MGALSKLIHVVYWAALTLKGAPYLKQLLSPFTTVKKSELNGLPTKAGLAKLSKLAHTAELLCKNTKLESSKSRGCQKEVCTPLF